MFYPAEPRHLEQLLEAFFQKKLHASMPGALLLLTQATSTQGRLEPVPSLPYHLILTAHFVVIGPSHRGYMTCASAVPWETPLGIVDVDTRFIEALDIRIDEISHRNEHSIEVQAPIIKIPVPEGRGLRPS